MRPITLNLRSMKKIAGDKDCSTFMHEDGHQIKILHKALPAIQRKQIEKLPIHKAEGGPASEDMKSQDESTQPAKDVSVNVNTSPQQPQAVQPITIPQSNPSAILANVPTNAPVTQVPPNTNLISQDKTLNAPEAVNLQQQAARQQQAVDAAKGQTIANVEDAYAKQRAAIADRDQSNLREIKGHTDDFANYMADPKNKIDPNHYWENRTTGQKALGAIGLFLGGFGAGLTHSGSNPAMDYLNRQIDRDIDAQKARADQQKTIWGAYKQLYDDNNIANNLAKVSMNDIYTHKMNQVAAQLATPQAKAAADAFSAAKAIENNQLLLDSAGRKGTINSGEASGQSTVQNQQSQGKVVANKDSLLIPNHVDALKTLAYTPKAKEELPAIQAQYNQAIQAQKAIDSLHDTYKDLSQNAAKSGEFGNARRNFAHDLSKLPFGVGEVIGAPLRYATDTESNRLYESNKTALLGDISAALKGTNIGSGQIQEAVDANSPEAGDSPEVINKKEENIKRFIKKHTDTSLLHKWGLSNK